LKTYRADLHIHTVLSPCAEIEMLPPLIVDEAVARGIQIIAITDHNASANTEAVQKAARERDLYVFPGMELQTHEEVHVLCLFDTLEQIHEFQAWVDGLLPDIENNTDYFGIQLVVDSAGELVREEKRLLLTSANASLEQAAQKVASLGGLLIPAHVDRKGYGLIGILGFVPQNVKIEGLEISRHLTPESALQLFPQISGYPLLQDGDAHRLEEMLGSTYLTIESPSIAEIRLALQSYGNRSVSIVR
jgi:PHP family Zn ribbon phosphoesterase